MCSPGADPVLDSAATAAVAALCVAVQAARVAGRWDVVAALDAALAATRSAFGCAQSAPTSRRSRRSGHRRRKKINETVASTSSDATTMSEPSTMSATPMRARSPVYSGAPLSAQDDGMARLAAERCAVPAAESEELKPVSAKDFKCGHGHHDATAEPPNSQFVIPQSILSLKDQHIRSLKDQIATLTSESESCKDAVTSVVKKELSIVSISDWCPRTMIPFLHQHIVTQEEIEEMNMNVVDAKGIRRQVELVHSAPWQTDISDMEYPLKLTLVLKKVTPPIDAGSLPIQRRELRPT